jgi:DNA-binding LacI/PurR family transcriptional regulator
VSASFLATRHLFQRGARRIFFINSPEDFIQSRQRLEGYTLGHSESARKVDKPLVVSSDFKTEDGYAATRKALGVGLSFDAMLCCNDNVALGAINALREAGIAVPDKIPVMGMGGSAIGGITSPAITTVDFSPYEMGSLAAKLLIEVIQRKRIQPCHTILPPKLVIRETA